MPYPAVSLIIPCYNESVRLPLLFDGLRSFAEQWKGDFECIVIDDGSTDDTAALIEAHEVFRQFRTAGRMFLLQQENTGKGGALKAGVSVAQKDFVLTLDADMATSPLELCHWLAQKNVFAEREILIASRELKTSVVKDSVKRKFIGHVFNFIIRHTVHLDLRDTQCGFKLYPAKVARTLFSDLQTNGWAHDVEILMKAKRSGIVITEMPVKWDAVPGSKIRILPDSWRMFREVMRISRL